MRGITRDKDADKEILIKSVAEIISMTKLGNDVRKITYDIPNEKVFIFYESGYSTDISVRYTEGLMMVKRIIDAIVIGA